jgi:hypothetical protein
MQFPPTCPLIPQAHDAHAEDMEKADAEDNQRYDDHRKCEFNHGDPLIIDGAGRGPSDL